MVANGLAAFHGGRRDDVRHGDGGRGEKNHDQLRRPIGGLPGKSHILTYEGPQRLVPCKFRTSKLSVNGGKKICASGGPHAGYEKRVRQLAESVHWRFRYHSIELAGRQRCSGPANLSRIRQSRLSLPSIFRRTFAANEFSTSAPGTAGSVSSASGAGPEVVAVDCVELDTFLEAKELLGSRVEYLTLDVNELSASRLGRFDIVLFLGVLYHLRHPLARPRESASSCRRISALSGIVRDSFGAAACSRVMEFYERTELGGQIDNWCGPSPECLVAFCRSAGFAGAEIRDITNARASVVCRRHWPDPAEPASPAPHLHSAVNNRTYMARFHPLKDEYLCCYFKSDISDLTPQSVLVEVDGYGVPASDRSLQRAGSVADELSPATRTRAWAAQGPAAYQRQPAKQYGRIHDAR